MIFTDLIGIVADDLTGANDTALQFFNLGAKTRILLDTSYTPDNRKKTSEVLAISSESRNCSTDEAIKRVENAVMTLDENFSIEFYYKKIDSTLRGHIAQETLLMLNLLKYDASVIIPAFPQEGRITVGGYHLLKGIPIGKTEIAMDPHSPILESHVPSLLKSQLNDEHKELVGVLDLKTVMNGAGPILIKLNDLIKNGKKLIIADAVSITDIEQISLAVNKCDKKILPTGTAAGAQVFGKIWLADFEIEKENTKIPAQPKLIVSGTATKITAEQIEKLEQSDDFNNINFIPLAVRDILCGIDDEMVSRIVTNLKSGTDVCVHTSHLITNFDGFSDDSDMAELTKDKFSSMITDYLAELTKHVLSETDAILITLGGETSYKCCSKINSKILEIQDEAAPAISLCSDLNGRLVVTKSGNLGKSKTLIDILNYLKYNQE